MKKTFIYCSLAILICCLNIPIFSYANSVEDLSQNNGEQIFLYKRVTKRTRSLFPDIQAFKVSDNLLTIYVNQNLNSDIHISLYEEENEVYSETFTITEAAEIPVLYDFDSTKSYTLEIIVGDYVYTGEF